MKIVLIACMIVLNGCCIDPEANLEVGNIITYEGNRVCADSTHRGLASSGKICGRICPKETP